MMLGVRVLRGGVFVFDWVGCGDMVWNIPNSSLELVLVILGCVHLGSFWVWLGVWFVGWLCVCWCVVEWCYGEVIWWCNLLSKVFPRPFFLFVLGQEFGTFLSFLSCLCFFVIFVIFVLFSTFFHFPLQIPFLSFLSTPQTHSDVLYFHQYFPKFGLKVVISSSASLQIHSKYIPNTF